MDILRESVFNGVQPAVTDVIVDVDVSTLDKSHVLPNMGSTVVRGVWFPLNELGHVVGYTAAGGIAPFIWTEQEGSRDLSTMIDPTSPTVPQAQTIAARAINDHGWIAINAHNFDGTDRYVYVLAPKFADDPTPCACGPAC